MSTQEDTPTPRYGDIQPVPVHVTGVDVGVSMGTPAPEPAPARAVATRFGTETVDDTNPVRPILPADPDRVCAYVQATGGDVFLAASEGNAKQAQDSPNSAEGTFLSHTNTAPWPIRGTEAVWAAQVTATNTCVVSFTADYKV